MEIHPWTKYEVARLRHEERILRVRDAIQALEVRHADASEPPVRKPYRIGSLLARLRRQTEASAAQAHSEAT